MFIRSFMPRPCRSPDVEGSGAPEETPEADAVVEVSETKVREPTAYEKRLRTENAKLHQRMKSAEAKAAEAAAAAASFDAKLKAEVERVLGEAKTATEGALAEARTAAERRVVAAEIKSAALAAGMRDPGDVRLLDLSAVTLDEKGDVQIPDGFFDELRKAKAYLFADAKDGPATGFTAPVAQRPAPATGAGKAAKELSAAEWSAEMKRLGVK